MTTDDSTNGLIELADRTGFVRCESMPITNDPRFFTGNVVDKRLAAFHVAGWIAVFMFTGGLGQLFGMKKDITFDTFWPSKDADGLIQLASFFLMFIVVLFNMIGTYVMVAQIYHTYRLMTAGPTGFEMATSYYLNKNIIFWRHFSIKCMLIGWPIYLVSMGLRLMVKFNRDMVKHEMWISVAKPTAKPLPTGYIGQLNAIGIIVCAIFFISAIFVYGIHARHFSVFKERYELAMVRSEGFVNMMSQVQTMSTRTRDQRHGIDF
jgi:hypothetical protein